MKATRSNPCSLPENAGSIRATRGDQRRAEQAAAALAKTPKTVSLSTYGNEIQVFYSYIEIRRHNVGSPRLEWVDFPWKVLLEQRELTPFPAASSLHENSAEANRLIGFLNTTEDVLVFKIAMNALMEVVQGKGCRLLYPGERYRVELLDEAVEAAKEE